jgi:type II secretory pathway pseudopilin PulG
MNDMSDILYLMAGMVLFSILVTNTNASFVRNTTMMVESEVEYSAITIAQSIIDEARTKAFDRILVGSTNILGDPDNINPALVPGSFTSPNGLGPDAGEVYPNFNDFDDFDNLTLTRSTGYGDFEITVSVFYVNPNNPATNVGARTISKRIVVNVTNDFIPNGVTLNYIRTYY